MAALETRSNRKSNKTKTRKTNANMQQELDDIQSKCSESMTRIKGPEIIIGIVSHGQDLPDDLLSEKFKNISNVPNIRMCVAGDLGIIYTINRTNHIDSFYDSLNDNYCFENLKWEKRKLVVENILKMQKIQKINNNSITNEHIKHIKPRHDHLYEFDYNPSIKPKNKYRMGNFTALFSSLPDENVNTYFGGGNGDMLKSEYWKEKSLFTEKETETKRIRLSSFIKRLSRYGYNNIYVIDISCRSVKNNLPKMLLNTIRQEEESPGNYSYDSKNKEEEWTPEQWEQWEKMTNQERKNWENQESRRNKFEKMTNQERKLLEEIKLERKRWETGNWKD